MSTAADNGSRPWPDAYLRTKVMTARPEELRLMLLEGALKFAEKGRAGLAAGDPDATFEGISRCQAILTELLSGLSPQVAPDLCDKLSGIYTFLFNRLIDAHQNRDPALVDEVIELLGYERETWVMVMKKLGESSAQEPLESGPAPIAGGSLSITG